MVFSSAIFLFFFLPLVYIGYRLLPGLTWQNTWLAAASLLFYAFGQPVYLLLLLLSVFGNYLFGRWLMSGRRPKLAAGCAVAANLLLLGTFKYLDFFAGTLNALLGLKLPLPGITLPIGISFYTFQGLSYVLDVYRNPASGTRRFGKLLLYVSFFPQLIAGPIVKYHDVARQIDQRSLTPQLTLSGLRRFISGLGKKLLLANTVGRVADAVFRLSAPELDLRLAWLGAVCYTLQIYFDFSGYSDMAIGLGRLFGFTFQENFQLPYTSCSIREFWRRWHISLSSWFRDYLYIPLGGNRKGTRRALRNRLLVFLATGLWHGANWTFVLWGLWHGLWITLEVLGIVPEKLRRGWPGRLYTMLVVLTGFVLFRAETVSAAGVLLLKMVTGFQFSPAHDLLLRQLLDPAVVCTLLAALLLAAGLPQRWCQTISRRLSFHRRLPAAVLFYGLLFVVSVLALAGTTYNPFIYFQF